MSDENNQDTPQDATATPDTPDVKPDTPQDAKPEGVNPNSEAKKYRLRLREAEKETADLKAKLEEYEKAETARKLAADRAAAAEEYGLPENLIIGNTPDEWKANAQAISEYIAEKTRPVVHVPGEGKQPSQPLSGISGNLFTNVMNPHDDY